MDKHKFLKFYFKEIMKLCSKNNMTFSSNIRLSLNLFTCTENRVDSILFVMLRRGANSASYKYEAVTRIDEYVDVKN